MCPKDRQIWPQNMKLNVIKTFITKEDANEENCDESHPNVPPKLIMEYGEKRCVRSSCKQAFYVCNLHHWLIYNWKLVKLHKFHCRSYLINIFLTSNNIQSINLDWCRNYQLCSITVLISVGKSYVNLFFEHFQRYFNIQNYGFFLRI